MKNAVLTSKVEGSTTIIHIVPEGTTVKAGDLICELDSAALVEKEKTQEIAVSSAESALTTAEKEVEIQRTQNASDVAAAQLKLDLAKIDLIKFQKGDYEQQLNELKSQALLQRETLEQAHEVVEFTARLVKKGYKTQNDLENELLKEKTARTNLAVAEDKLRVLEQYTFDRTIRELEANAEEFQKEIKRVELKGEAALTQRLADVKARKKTYEVELDKLETIRRQIANCKIYAPQDGQVIYANQKDGRSSEQVLIEEGATVRERQQIVMLPDLSEMKVNARVHESRISLMRKGLPVTVKVDAFPDETFRGVVDTVASVPSSTGSSYMRDIKEYDAVVRLLDETEKVSRLRPGLTAQLEVLVESRDDVLQAPIQSVLNVVGQQIAFVVSGERVQRRNVTVGQTNERVVEILNGLDEGDLVVMNPRSHFEKDIKELEAELVKKNAETPAPMMETPNGLPQIPAAPPAGEGPRAPRSGSEQPTGAPASGPLASADGATRQFDPAAFFERMDVNSDGKLSGDEIPERMRERVPAMDTDGDGSVSLAEFQAAPRPAGGTGGAGARRPAPAAGGSE